MEFALSTHLFVNERLTATVLSRVLDAGFRKIEIFAARQHLDYCDANQVRDAAQWFQDHGLELHSVHAPLFADFDWGRSSGLAISIAHLEKRHRITSSDEIKRALEIAERLPFRYLILHLGLEGEEYDLRKFDAALTSLEHLRVFAKGLGVEILLENIPNQLATPERLIQFIRFSRLEDLKVCFDTGHAHMTTGVRAGFETLKDRIASTHVHDNRGDKDEHLFPFDGGINWEQALDDFRAAGDGRFPLLLELRHYGPQSSLERLAEVMEKMNALTGPGD